MHFVILTRVFQHMQESWFEAVHVGWGRNSQDGHWAELLTTQAGSEREGKRTSLSCTGD